MNTNQQAVFEDAIAFVNRATKAKEVPEVDPQHDLMWDQSSWLETDSYVEVPDTEDVWCGTSCCVAGYVVLNAALEATLNAVEVEQQDHHAIAWEFAKNWAHANLGYSQDEIEEAGEDIIGTVAGELMGLDDYEADDLFVGSNSVDRINMLAAEIRTKHSTITAITKGDLL